MTESAQLCVAGRDAKVKVYNIKDGTIVHVRRAFSALLAHRGLLLS